MGVRTGSRIEPGSVSAHPLGKMSVESQVDFKAAGNCESCGGMNTAGSNKLAQAANDSEIRLSIHLVLPSLLLQESTCAAGSNSTESLQLAGGLYLVIPAQATCCARAR